MMFYNLLKKMVNPIYNPANMLRRGHVFRRVFCKLRGELLNNII